MIQEATDETLVSQIKDGSHHAFNTLVRRHARSCYNISYRYICSREGAEDIVQAAFLKLWEYPDKFNPALKVPFKAWFIRVVVNMSIDAIRRRKPNADIDDFQIADDGIRGEEYVDKKRKSAMLERAIRQLPARQQTALNLGICEQMPYAEVAAVMKTNLKSVQSLIMRAKGNLKKMIGEEAC